LIHLTRVSEGETTAFSRRFAPSVLARQKTASDGVVGDDPYPLLTTKREHFTLYLSKQQVIARLHRVESHVPESLAASDSADELVGEKIRTSDVTDLSLVDEIVEGTERLVDGGRWIEPVELVKVDVVGL
jgi:hypothetical protein